jgi:hypothetical protein
MAAALSRVVAAARTSAGDQAVEPEPGVKEPVTSAG